MGTWSTFSYAKHLTKEDKKCDRNHSLSTIVLTHKLQLKLFIKTIKQKHILLDHNSVTAEMIYYKYIWLANMHKVTTLQQN